MEAEGTSCEHISLASPSFTAQNNIIHNVPAKMRRGAAKCIPFGRASAQALIPLPVKASITDPGFCAALRLESQSFS